jgi:hypothetical protein
LEKKIQDSETSTQMIAAVMAIDSRAQTISTPRITPDSSRPRRR